LPRKILLADDSVTAQNMGRKILADAGYEVITVNNGSAALKKITELHPDLIVLDVYMPGYSGLEVCQRIKEGNDTARIPVLLTVGKLEPFKQDEARRARADAFIIKPFEATELLAAVSKLQDKLGVVPAVPSKETRFASATMNSFEKAMEQAGPKFGDQDSGWKARLTIPHGPSQPAGEEPDAMPAPAAAAFRDLVEEKPAPATKNFSGTTDRPIPNGIPQDITADEIAALTAAAQRVNVGMSVGKDFERFKHEPQPAEGVAPAEHPDTKPREKTNAVETASTSGKNSVQRPEAQQTGPVAETTAKSTASATAAVAAAKVAEPAAVAEAATIAAAPRWVAEEIPLQGDESTLVLEREMHKAFAAFAAAEYFALPPDERGAVDKDDEPMFASMAPPAIGSPVPVAEETNASREAETESMASPTPADSASKPLVTKPPAAPFASAAAMKVDEEDHAVAAFGGPDPFAKSETEEAAQTAKETTLEISAAPVSAAVEAKTISSEKPSAAEPTPAWKDVRESEASKSPANSDGKNTDIERLKSGEGVAEKELVREAAMAAAASADGGGPDLSSIVDNMLAELKPKLMAELAKKLDKK